MKGFPPSFHKIYYLCKRFLAVFSFPCSIPAPSKNKKIERIKPIPSFFFSSQSRWLSEITRDICTRKHTQGEQCKNCEWRHGKQKYKDFWEVNQKHQKNEERWGHSRNGVGSGLAASLGWNESMDAKSQGKNNHPVIGCSLRESIN